MLTSEHVIRLDHHYYNLKTTCLRLANLFGPRQPLHTNNHNMIGWIFRHVARDEPFTFDGDGNQTRDFLYVDDACDAIIACMENPEKTDGETFNVGGLDYATWNWVMVVAGKTFNRGVKVTYVPQTPADLKSENPYSRLNSQKIARVLGWKPKVGLEEGFRRMKEYFTMEKIKTFLD
jgi:UDP-glucose 4-epimerase